jgi:hypothetical protein
LTLDAENPQFKGENRQSTRLTGRGLGVFLSKTLRGVAEEGALSPRLFRRGSSLR